MKESDELNTCDAFPIGCLLWGTKRIPTTYGRIGFVPKEGFYLAMTCQESSPLRTYTEDNSQVYKDSAMEAFFCFYPDGTPSDLYLNFEMNANGALLAMYGKDRICRTEFSSDWIAKCRCHADIFESEWTVTLFVPLAILEAVYGALNFCPGTELSVNFYKLSENAAIEHYASYAPVYSPVPNFHMTECFEPSVLVIPSE